MFTQPEDLTDHAVAETVMRGWGLAVDEIAYAAVGFGSHHWNVVGDDVKWFVTADDLDARVQHAGDTRTQVRQRLVSALSTAYAPPAARLLVRRGTDFEPYGFGA